MTARPFQSSEIGPSGYRAPIKWYHAYFLLAAFAVLTLSLSLFLNHRLVVTHTQTVRGNLQWVARLSQCDTLRHELSELGTLGSHVLDSHDVEPESVKIQAALARFDGTLGMLRGDIQNPVSTQDAAALL